MADDASGSGTDDRDGRDERSETTPTATDWGDEHVSARDEEGDSDRIPLDFSGPDSDRESADTTDGDPDEYVPEPSSARIESGDPDLEHAIFVLLGAVVTVLVIVRLLALPLG